MTDVSPATTLLLPRANPADVGIPAAAVESLLTELESRSLELHSLMVVRHGHVVAEGWWSPYSPERVHLLNSLSKSFTSTAVGFCVHEGLFRLDDRVLDLLPDQVPDDVHPAVASLTVHHLLSMSTGHREDTLERAWRLEPHDLVRGFLRLPPEEPVGSRHAYNNPTTYVLAALVERAAGVPLLDYLRPRLLDPLGIGAARWDVDEHGQALAFTGLHLQTEAVAAFGQLLLQDGRWGGARILPEGWVGLATRKHVDNDDDPTRPVDWRQGYGYQYWMARHGYRGDGAHGQFCIVVPGRDLVVATTACLEDMQQVLDAVWERLLPALDQPDDGEYAAQARLRARLGSLALPVPDPRHDGPTGAVTFTVRSSDPDGTAPLAAQSTLTVTPDGADALLTIDLGGTSRARLTLRCGRDRWVEGALASGGADRGARGLRPTVATPVVCRGGWTAPDTFEADLVLIETPHRVQVCGKGSTLTAIWNAPPLMGPRLESYIAR